MRWLVLATAGALVVIGAVVLLVPGPLGWLSYTADSRSVTVALTSMYPLTPARGVGAAIAVLGLLLAAGLVGWTLGRRSARRSPLAGTQPSDVE
jgi:hypothetical protein